MFDFTNKTVIVTGAGQGIGKETAKGIIEGNGKVIICDINEKTGLATKEELGENAYFYRMDCGDNKNIREVITKILKEHDNVTGLINVAGVISKKPFQEISDEEWERTIRMVLSRKVCK